MSEGGVAAVDEVRPSGAHADEASLRARFPGGIPLEGPTRLSESLEARISLAYWTGSGLAPYRDDEVPFVATNDGLRAAHNAEVLFASCLEAEDAGTLEDEIIVVEMGMGVGLHARLLLMRFRALCEQRGRAFHERLTFVASDLSRTVVSEVQAAGTLADLGVRVLFGIQDAMAPGRVSLQSPAGGDVARLPWRAVFHNYLFDTLPSTLLMFDHGAWYELLVQTRLGDPWRLADETGVTVDALLRLLAEEPPSAAAALARAGQLVAVDCVYRAIAEADVPFAPLVEAYVRRVLAPLRAEADSFDPSVRVWVPWGALTSLERTYERLAPGGLLLFSDYGPIDAVGVLAARSYQRYGAGICIPVPFPLIELHARALGFEVSAPSTHEGVRVHPRLMTRGPAPASHARFKTLDAAEGGRALQAVLGAARDQIEVDLAGSLARFELVAEREPMFWPVLEEWSVAACFRAGDPEGALALADRALTLNPTCSPTLWCVRGDALVALARYDEAIAAYERALAIDAGCARAHYNRGWILAGRGRLEDALLALARALATDADGSFRSLILDKQAEILTTRDRIRDARGPRFVTRRF